nr:MerR family DNA-binding transcriptional regulator [Kribbella qitaiheensis]
MSSPPNTGPAHFDDDDYPAFTMGRARGDARHHSRVPAKPRRSQADHPTALGRRPPPVLRYQLRLAARARELVDQGTALEAACRIIILEDQLAEALRINEQRKQN